MGKPASGNPSLSANAAREAGDDANPDDVELTPSIIQTGVPQQLHGHASVILTIPATGSGQHHAENPTSRNPSLSANAARAAGDDANLERWRNSRHTPIRQ